MDLDTIWTCGPKLSSYQKWYQFLNHQLLCLLLLSWKWFVSWQRRRHRWRFITHKANAQHNNVWLKFAAAAWSHFLWFNSMVFVEGVKCLIFHFYFVFYLWGDHFEPPNTQTLLFHTLLSVNALFLLSFVPHIWLRTETSSNQNIMKKWRSPSGSSQGAFQV